MKNMKKIVILIITLFLVIATILGYNVHQKKVANIESSQNNRSYESFYNQPVLGTDIISVINKAIDSNEKNLVEKDEEGNYIDNEKNSVKIDIKFKELEQVISMERIDKIGMKQFRNNYGTFNFKCTKIEYHEKTNNVKYMYFEEI